MSGGVRNVCRFLSGAGKPPGIFAGERRVAGAEPVRSAGREAERGGFVPPAADGRERDRLSGKRQATAKAGQVFCRSGGRAVFPGRDGERVKARLKRGPVVAVFSAGLSGLPRVSRRPGERRQGRDGGRYGAGDGGISFFSGLAG